MEIKAPVFISGRQGSPGVRASCVQGPLWGQHRATKSLWTGDRSCQYQDGGKSPNCLVPAAFFLSICPHGKCGLRTKHHRFRNTQPVYVCHQHIISHSLLCLLCESSPVMAVQTFRCLLHAFYCPRKLGSDSHVHFCLCSSSAHNLMASWDSQRC